MSLTKSIVLAALAAASYAEAVAVTAREFSGATSSLTIYKRDRVITIRGAGKSNAAALKRASKKRRNIRRFGGLA